MRILFYRYGNICEPDVIEQFKQLGLEVTCIENEITDKKLSASKRVELISSRLKQASFLFVFSINFFPAISDVCNIFKVKYVCWSVDAPVLELFDKAVANPCNRIFCFDKAQYNEISPYNPGNIYHLPLCTNTDRWSKVISGISKEDRQKYSSDISFVGSLYTEHDPIASCTELSAFSKGYIQGLCDSQKQIYGYNLLEQSLTKDLIDELKQKMPKEFAISNNAVISLDNYIAAHQLIGHHCSSLERVDLLTKLSEHHDVNLFTRSDTSLYKNYPHLHCHKGVATLTEMPKIFNLSKINLNITIRSIRTGISLRLFDVLGCGGFLLTNYQEEMNDYFVAGEDYDYFTDSDDLIEKCNFYLANEEIRKKIALSGYEKVSKYHTYINRLPVIFKSCLDS